MFFTAAAAACTVMQHFIHMHLEEGIQANVNFRTNQRVIRSSRKYFVD